MVSLTIYIGVFSLVLSACLITVSLCLSVHRVTFPVANKTRTSSALQHLWQHVLFSPFPVDLADCRKQLKTRYFAGFFAFNGSWVLIKILFLTSGNHLFTLIFIYFKVRSVLWMCRWWWRWWAIIIETDFGFITVDVCALWRMMRSLLIYGSL